MSIIWRGVGWLVPVLFVLCLVGGEFFANYFSGDPDFWRETAWVKNVALAVSGLLIGFVGLAANIQDDDTIGSYHSFFFIPFQYWGVLAPAGLWLVIYYGL